MSLPLRSRCASPQVIYSVKFIHGIGAIDIIAVSGLLRLLPDLRALSPQPPLPLLSHATSYLRSWSLAACGRHSLLNLHSQLRADDSPPMYGVSQNSLCGSLTWALSMHLL